MLRSLRRLRAIPAPPSHRTLLTLAIESSCDDTSVAVLETRHARAVLHFHEKVTADSTIHKGVHPIVSLESHQENLSALVQKAIRHLPGHDCSDDSIPFIYHGRPDDGASKFCRKTPDFISVTRGPGMRANLFTGLDTAKGLATAWGIPLVGVHHMHAHALTPRLVSALATPDEPDQSARFRPEPEFPFLSLLISGGHTLVIHSESLTEQRVLGSTTDCAVGECLDKVARLVVPSYLVNSWGDTMYGRLLERFAFPNGHSDYDYTPPKNKGQGLSKHTTRWGWAFSPPLAQSPNGLRSTSMDMSFTGLQTAVERVMSFHWDKEAGKLSKIPREAHEVDEEERRTMAREAMRVAFEHLASRVLLALQAISLKDPEAAKKTSIVVSGGVASNKYLRHVFSAFLAARGYPDIELFYPPPELCTDNAAMIAWAGIEMYRAGHRTPLTCRALRKWSLEELMTPSNGN